MREATSTMLKITLLCMTFCGVLLVAAVLQ